MPYEQIPDGLYLLRQKSRTKNVDHYGILDVGNRFSLTGLGVCEQPVVIHQTPPSIRIDWLQHTGAWEILGAVQDEAAAITRVRDAFHQPEYNLFGNNCEHFARYVATGRRECKQIQAAVLVAGLVALTARL